MLTSRSGWCIRVLRVYNDLPYDNFKFLRSDIEGEVKTNLCNSVVIK